MLKRIKPEKDVDGFHPYNAGLLSQGQGHLIPCTAKGVAVMLESLDTPLSGLHAVVIGRSNIVGRPVAQLLEQHNCTVTLCHSRTQNLDMHLACADIVVVAVGRANFVHGSSLKEGCIVIDVGINRLENGSLCGDVDFASAKEKAKAGEKSRSTGDINTNVKIESANIAKPTGASGTFSAFAAGIIGVTPPVQTVSDNELRKLQRENNKTQREMNKHLKKLDNEARFAG